MDIFSGLRKLLGIGDDRPQVQARAPVVQGAVNPTEQVRNGNTPYSLGEGPQTTGFAPMTNQEIVQPARPVFAPNQGAVIGSVNPSWQQSNGFTPYSPGEGPQTKFPTFEEILRRR